MKVLCIFLAGILICITGCTTGYNVHVNAFSELTEPIESDSAIYVVLDSNAPNPVFDNRIKARIEQLLKHQGLTPSAQDEPFDYTLSFETGVDSQQVLDYGPMHHSYVGFHYGYWSDYHFGYFTHYPYYETFHTQRLSLKLIKTAWQDNSGQDKVVWICDAIIGTRGHDPRDTIDFLLVGCLEYFGIDTIRQKTLFIEEDDYRLMQIKSLR
ncbi:hypothetical protein ACFLZ8_03980 [Planctomycetota bacterium]